MTAATAAAAPATRRGVKRADIQVLRGLAVLLVVLFHLRAPYLYGGFVGVDVFFVVSGFLVGGALAKEAISTGRVDFAAFFARRARRILPASMVTVSVVAVVVAVAHSPLRNMLWGRPLIEESFAKDALAAIAYVPNLWFMEQGSQYGAATSSSPYLHFWSLGVEEQFYFVAPFVIAMLWFAVRKRMVAFAVAIAALGAASLAYALLAPVTEGDTGYFDPLARAWQLVAGVLAALAAARLASMWTRRAATWTMLAGFAGIAASALLIDGEGGWPRWTALGVVASTALVLVAGGKSASLGVVARPLEWIGDRSYSWYLWHWPVLVLGDWMADGRLGRVALGGLALGSLVIADQQYRWVERPAMRWPVGTRTERRKLWRRSVAFIATAVVVVAASASWSHHRLAGFDVDAVAAPLADAAPGAPPLATYAPPDLSQPMLDFSATVPSNLRPGLAVAATDVPAFFDDGCQVKGDERLDPLPECSYGDGATTVVLFGDSHTAQWFAALEPWIERGDVTVVPLTAAGCTAMPVSMDKSRPGCVEWRASATARIGELKPDVVIIGARYHGFANANSRAKQIASGIRTAFPALVEDSRVYYIVDNPAQTTNAPACAAQDRFDLSRCGLPADEAISAVAEARVARAAVEVGATYLNFNNYMCNPEWCGVVLGDVLVYRDNDHLTQEFVASLWRPVGAAIGLEE